MVDFQSFGQIRNHPIASDATTILHVPALNAHRARAVSAFPQVPFFRLAPAADTTAGGLSIAQSLVPPLLFFYRKQGRSGTLTTGATEGVRIPTAETGRVSAARAGLSRTPQHPSTDMTARRAVTQAPGDHRAPDCESEHDSPDFNHSRISQARISQARISQARIRRADRQVIARQLFIPAQYPARCDPDSGRDQREIEIQR